MAARDYQLFAAQSIWDFFEKKSGHPLVLMPTGTGKSHVISIFAQSVLAYFPRTRIICATHVKELIQQNYNKLVEAWPTAPAGIYSASLGQRDIHNNIVFGGIQSMAKKAHAFGHVDMVLVDEAHTVSPSETTLYRKFIDALTKVNPNLKVIGLTATGWRLGHGKIHEGEGALFTDVCVDMTTVEIFNWFISEGYLLPLHPKKPKSELDVSGVHMRGGEFIQSELQNAVDKADITLRALEEAVRDYSHCKKWLIFASGVEHAVHISDALNELGVTCGYVHGALSDGERDEVLRKHRVGELKAITNNNVLTTGYDDPEIDLIIVLRPTASPVLWVQLLGRGTRPVWPTNDGSNWHLWPQGYVASGRYDLGTTAGRILCIQEGPKQFCSVLDFSGNTRRLGPVNDPVIPGKKGSKGGPAPVKLCEACEHYNHASARFCAICGAEFTFTTKLKQAASTEKLIKGDTPVVEVYRINEITYQPFERSGKPRMLRVTYYCNLRKFDEYICIEHPPGFAKMRADKWLRKRTDSYFSTVDQLLQSADQLRRPTHISVWINKQYAEIMDYDFEGTAFGREPPQVDSQYPEIKVGSGFRKRAEDLEIPVLAPSKPLTGFDDMDDDIPF